MNYDIPVHSAKKVEKHKVQNWVNTDILLNILDSPHVSQKFWNTVLFHLLRFVAFKTSGLNILKVYFKLFKCSDV